MALLVGGKFVVCNGTKECLYSERCDCGDRIRHNNGGNYHVTAWVRTFHVRDNETGARVPDVWAIVIHDDSSREVFPKDEFEQLVFDGMWRWEPCGFCRLPNVFRYGEARIVADAGEGNLREVAERFLKRRATFGELRAAVR